MSAKIPQDVTREDRLFGPLTLRQFLYALFGAGIIFVAYEGYSTGYLYFVEFAIIAFLVGSLAIALAFAKVNGRTFSIFLANLWHFIAVPKRWGWTKEDRETATPIKIKAVDIKDTRTEAQERKSGKVIKMQIEQLATVLDTGGTMNPDHDAIVASQVSNLPTQNPQLKLELTSIDDVLANTD